MKVIFLDFDGVLITRWQLTQGWHYNADLVSVYELNRIIHNTDARIVVSSAWRIGSTVEELQEQLTKWGVIGDVIGRTPCDWDSIRGHEIQVWLNRWHDTEFERVESFVILDDDTDMGALMSYLVKTTIENGLTPELADQAIALLNTKVTTEFVTKVSNLSK